VFLQKYSVLGFLEFFELFSKEKGLGKYLTKTQEAKCKIPWIIDLWNKFSKENVME
jgi:hypothetical protein